MLVNKNVDEDKDFKAQVSNGYCKFLQLFRTLFSPSTKDQRKAEILPSQLAGLLVPYISVKTKKERQMFSKLFYLPD
jgi:hypothetical protein